LDRIHVIAGVPCSDLAGLRVYRKARTTGTHVSLYDGPEAGLDYNYGRWNTVCEEHGCIIQHKTYAIALSHLSYPNEWCEECILDEIGRNDD